MWRVVVLVFLGTACKGDSEANNSRTASAPAVRVEQELSKIVATTAEVQGLVEVRRKGQPQWEQVGVGTALRERDWVRTGAGAFARIRYGAGGFLDLRGGTTILVDSAITVEAGTLVGVAEPGSAPLVVRSADGSEARIVATAQGQPAEFRLTPGASGLEIAVIRGSVDVLTAAGAQPVGMGEASDLSNQRASAAVKLLGFPRTLTPGVDARFLFAPDLRVTMTWKSLAGASRYRVQVAHDTDFRALVLDTESTASALDFSPPDDGAYAWRVAGIDAAGRLGEYGFARRLFLETEPPRELLVAPRDGVKFGFSDERPRVRFSWESSGDATQYKLVIAHRELSDPVVTKTTNRQQLEITTLREGAYVWGVYAIRDDREIPIFLAPRHFMIRKQRVKAHTDRLWDR